VTFEALTRLTAILGDRLPATDPQDLAAAIVGSGVSRIGMSRLAGRLAAPDSVKWPHVALSGIVPFQLATALHEAGIIANVPGCSRCGRARALELYGSPEPTCHSCGKRNSDGSSARGPRRRTGQKTCPGGHHQMSRTARLCLACADEQAIVIVEAAVMEVGATAEQARTIITETATPLPALRQIARWLQAGGSLADPGAGTVAIQRFRNPSPRSCPLSSTRPARPADSRVRLCGTETATTSSVSTATSEVIERYADLVGERRASHGVTKTAGLGAATAGPPILTP
jgi:hypothetical protein